MKIGKRRLEWRLKPLMKSRGIRNVLDLHRRLLEVTPKVVSVPQLYNIVRRVPWRINTRVLLALTEVLDCEISDLITIHHEEKD